MFRKIKDDGPRSFLSCVALFSALFMSCGVAMAHVSGPALISSVPAFGPGAAPALLPASKAFIVNASARRGDIHIQWIAAPGYHIYRSTLAVSSPGVRVGVPVVSRSTSSGYTVLDARFPYCGGGKAALSPLVVMAQGCHASSPAVCYPPQRRMTSVPLPRKSC